MHAVALLLLQSTLTAVSAALPAIAKKGLGANDYEVTIITSAVNVMAIVSIFWGALFARMRLGTYLSVYWAAALLPLGLCAFAEGYGLLAVLAVIAAAGNAGWTPVAADMLKRLYPDVSRGRVYATLVTCTLLGGAVLGWGVGQWLELDASGFRVYMPIAAGLQLLGLGMLWWLSSWAPAPDKPAPAPGAAEGARAPGPSGVRGRAAGLYRSAIEPVLHMGAVLKNDPLFARYEAAFMTYGCGFMMSAALVPLLALNKLELSYDRFAAATIVAFQVAQLATTLPAGLAIDRFGASRTCQYAFALYAVYPVMLLLAAGAPGLAAATAVFGVAAAFVNMGWMLGPVTFAPTPDKVSAYIAIHTSLVGLRGIVFQFAGVALYKLTDSFTVPLLVASAAFIWASLQMRTLARMLKERRRDAANEALAPAASNVAMEPDALPSR